MDPEQHSWSPEGPRRKDPPSQDQATSHASLRIRNATGVNVARNEGKITSNATSNNFYLQTPDGYSRLSPELSNLLKGELGSHSQGLKADDPRFLDQISSHLGHKNVLTAIKPWVMPASGMEQTYESRRQQCHPGTCSWILAQSWYLQWASLPTDQFRPRLLWVHGGGGFGKSVLCAYVLQKWLNAAASVAYFFCSASSEKGHHTQNIIRTLLWQLALENPRIASLIWLQVQDPRSEREASVDQARDLFIRCKSLTSNLVIIVDGLDECADQSTEWRDGSTSLRGGFVEKLLQDTQGTNTRILLFSRHDAGIVQGVERGSSYCGFHHKHHLSTLDMQSDITSFVDSIVQRRLASKSDLDKTEIAARLQQRCSGMFLLATLHSDNLKDRRPTKQILRAIDGLPADLDQLYERDWDNIQKHGEYERTRARNILLWLTFAVRLLRVGELAEALAIAEEDGPLELVDDTYVQQEILGLCGSLIACENHAASPAASVSTHSTIVFAHETARHFVKQKLVMDHAIDGEWGAQHALASWCLECLTHKFSKQDASQVVPHFFDYATLHWYDHISAIQPQPQPPIVTKLEDFFSSKNESWRIWRDRFEILSAPESAESEAQGNTGVDQDSKKSFPGERGYYAAYFGLAAIVEYLDAAGGCDWNQSGGVLGTPLQAACYQGHAAIVHSLLAKKVNVDQANGKWGCAINAAAQQGNVEIIQMLLQQNCRLDLVDDGHRTPLYLCAREGHVDALGMVLERQSDVNQRNAGGWTPINAAADGGHLEAVRLLIERGADARIANRLGWTPLSCAADYGYLQVVKLLIEKDVDIDAANGQGRTAVHCAASRGHLEILRLLMDRQADISCANSSGWTPFHLACDAGHLDVAKALEREGVSIHQADSQGQTPLYSATLGGHLDVVRFLLERGSNIKTTNKDGFTSLNAACYGGFLEIVKLLIARGASDEQASIQKQTPLYSACWQGHVGIVTFLLGRNVNIFTENENGRTPFQVACSCGHLAIAKMLLAKDADRCIQHTDHHHRTALYIASVKHQLEITQFLLDNGSQIDLADLGGYTPLNATSQDGHVEVVKLLVERGANIHQASKSNRTPLLSACFFGHAQVAQILLDRGADVHRANNHKTSPILIACESGYTDVVRILLQRGANVRDIDNDGDTPFELATRNGHQEVAQLLIAHDPELGNLRT